MSSEELGDEVGRRGVWHTPVVINALGLYQIVDGKSITMSDRDVVHRVSTIWPPPPLRLRSGGGTRWLSEAHRWLSGAEANVY